MDIDRITKTVIYLSVLIWLICALFRLLPMSQLYVFLGIIFLILGIKNLILLKLDFCGRHENLKLKEIMNRLGEKNGIKYYAVFMVGLFIMVAVLLIYLGIFG